MAGLSIILSSSCMKDDKVKDASADNKLHVKLEVSGYSTPATRAMVDAEEGEINISSLYLLFFDQSSGAFVDYIKVDGVTTMMFDVDLAEYPNIDINNHYYNILAMANTDGNNYTFYGNRDMDMDAWVETVVMSGKTQKQAMEEAIASVTEGDTIAPDGLLMSGVFVKPDQSNNLSLLLTRNVVRLDVINQMSSSYDLVTASIWNAYPQTSVWGGTAMDFSASTPRIERFYGLDNSENTVMQGEDELLGDINGGLYVFENQVVAPDMNDKLTTCLILGLRNRSDGTLSYYRANMNTEGSPQVLLKNNVYRLRITGISGDGYATEEIAYNGRGTNLEYTVNAWNMDDNGLITQDENSLISLPTKTIKIGRDGGDFDYSIFITSKLPNPAPLSIMSQMYEPADNGIVATINGNIIHVQATELAPEQTERRGIAILSYAGLQTSINIIQSGEVETFLTVTLPEGGIPVFQPFANLSSGLITVEASGPWSAKIYMDGFSFIEGRSVTEIRSTDVAYVNDDQFRIYTNTANPETSLRQAFVVVSLDSDPENYSSVIRVAQKPTGAIRVTPEQNSVTFTGTGGLLTPVPPATNDKRFIVLPNLETNPDTGTEYVPQWDAEIIQSGSFDDSAMFTITSKNWDTDIVNNNIIEVDAVGMNLSGRPFTATLRIFLSNNTDVFTEIAIRQEVIAWDIPANPRTIPAAGGTTDELRITVPEGLEGLHYTVQVQGLRPASLEGHFAYVIDTGDGDPGMYSGLQPNDVTKSFRVGYPKLIWPNVGVDPIATIAVTLVETGETKTFTVRQSAVTQRMVNILDVGAYSWGNFSSDNQNSTWTATWYGSYQTQLVDNLNPGNAAGRANFGPDGIVKTVADLRLSSMHSASAGNAVWPAVVDDVTFINYTRPNMLPGSDSEIWNWMRSSAEGFALINTEGSAVEGENDFRYQIPGRLGITGGGGAPLLDFGINPVVGNKIIDYLLDGPFGKVVDRSITLSNSGVRGYIDASSVEALGNGAVSVLQAPGTGDFSGRLLTGLMIDPSRNVIVKTDSEMFGRANVNSGDRNIFMRNLLGYMVNTAQYGSYFSDYFWDSPRILISTPQPQE